MLYRYPEIFILRSSNISITIIQISLIYHINYDVIDHINYHNINIPYLYQLQIISAISDAIYIFTISCCKIQFYITFCEATSIFTTIFCKIKFMRHFSSLQLWFVKFNFIKLNSPFSIFITVFCKIQFLRTLCITSSSSKSD